LKVILWGRGRVAPQVQPNPAIVPGKRGAIAALTRRNKVAERRLRIDMPPHRSCRVTMKRRKTTPDRAWFPQSFQKCQCFVLTCTRLRRIRSIGVASVPEQIPAHDRQVGPCCGPQRHEEDPGVELVDSGGAAGSKRTGAMLAAARAAAGLELVDVARETRVPLRHLKALETDSHDALPALPYSVGFVKAFARAVGLDPESVAAQFRAETSQLPHTPVALSMAPLDERRLPSPGLVFASIVVVAIVIAGLSAWGTGMFDPAPAPEVAAGLPVPPPAAAPGATVAAAGEAAPVGSDADAVAPAAVALAPVAASTVVLTAREEVWVKIYDKATDTTAKIGVLLPGESYTVPPEPAGLRLWTGKAGALAVTVAGKPLPPLGGPVETIRDVSLAAADLLARPAPAAAAPAAAGPKPIATVPGA